jgi:hypothetical protein
MKNTAWSWAVVAAWVGACGGELSQAPDSPAPLEQAPGASEEISAYGVSANGRNLNGRGLNGRNINGRNINGREFNGRSLLNAHLGPVPLSEVWLEGSSLVSRTSSGQVLSGADLVGAELGDATGRSPRMRVDAAEAQGDTWHYTVSYWTAGGWRPLCPGDTSPDQALTAIALAGRWDYRQGVPGGGAHIAEPGVITFACANAALAKCVSFGYAPWRQTVQCTSEGCDTVSLASYHQACTRMVRADYCGDGRSFTRDGTLINLYDGVGIQLDTESWAIEAEWDAQGARCISQRRLGSSSGPSCARNLYPTDCGAPAHFNSGTLLMTEFDASNQ